MQDTPEQQGGLLPADAQTAEVRQPPGRALDRPAPRHATERPAILRLGVHSVASMRGHQLYAFLLQPVVERVAVVGLVADHTLGKRAREYEVELPLHEHSFMVIGPRSRHSDR